MTTSPKYLPTEPPAVLTEPVSLTISDHALTELNDFRQAQHAWLGCTGDIEQRARLREKAEMTGYWLAATLAAEISRQLGEPRIFEPKDSAE